MSDFQSALGNAEAAIKEAVPGVVRKHRSAGTLTWRLLHQIEDEVLRELVETRRHSPQLLRMLRSSGLMEYPKDETEVELKGNAVPVAFGEVYRAWHRVD